MLLTHSCRGEEDSCGSLHLDRFGQVNPSWSPPSPSRIECLPFCLTMTEVQPLPQAFCSQLLHSAMAEGCQRMMNSLTCLQVVVGLEPFQMASFDRHIWACQPRTCLWISCGADCSQEIHQGGANSPCFTVHDCLPMVHSICLWSCAHIPHLLAQQPAESSSASKTA